MADTCGTLRWVGRLVSQVKWSLHSPLHSTVPPPPPPPPPLRFGCDVKLDRAPNTAGFSSASGKSKQPANQCWFGCCTTFVDTVVQLGILRHEFRKEFKKDVFIAKYSDIFWQNGKSKNIF